MSDELTKWSQKMKILKLSEQAPIIGSSDHYTGAVKLTRLVQGEEPACLTCAFVAFAPGARTAWHTHPKGQLLIVSEGKGVVQEWQGEVKIIEKGDIIWTPPQVKHWHGALKEGAMSHFALQESLNGQVVNWLEKVEEPEG
jgi:quercetin dioxygenase-like cupin family protein